MTDELDDVAGPAGIASDEIVRTIEYELFILQRMMDQLPDRAAGLLRRQLSKVLGALVRRDRWVCERLSAHKQILGDVLGDIRLHLKILEFDLETTRRERDDALRRSCDHGQ